MNQNQIWTQKVKTKISSTLKYPAIQCTVQHFLLTDCLLVFKTKENNLKHNEYTKHLQHNTWEVNIKKKYKTK